MLFLSKMYAKGKLLIVVFLTVLVLVPFSVQAQEYVEDAGYGEPSDLSQAPPSIVPQKVVAPPLINNSEYRPPVDPPANMVSKISQNRNSKQAVGSYQVQKGDSLASIAQKTMGSAHRWQELANFNNIRDPNSLYVGQVLRIPNQNDVTFAKQSAQIDHISEYETAEPETPSPPQKPSKKAKQSGKIPSEAIEADASYHTQSGGTYVVQPGDTMAKIAKKVLGSTKRWREIAKANPHVNPNKLLVGQTLVIPGHSVPTDEDMAIVQPPAQTTYGNYAAGNYSSKIGSRTSFDVGGSGASVEPPPAAPPPVDPNTAPLMSSPATGYAYTPPSTIMPPPAPTSALPEMPAPAAPAPAPVPPTTTTLYREERYRIPDELKPTNFTPYFTNTLGYHGLLETESALYPFIKTWHMGVSFRYDKLKYFNGKENVVDGKRWLCPVNILYTGKRLMAGLSVPFQGWEVKPSGTTYNTIEKTSIHDPDIKLGYQIWKNYEGTHAVSLHVGGRFTSDNYHVPFWVGAPGGVSGTTRVGARVGPANATKGSWAEFGGAYSGVLSERWASHVNLGLAHNSTDDISRYYYRGMMDYRVNNNFALIAEVSGSTWEMGNGPDGPNIDFTPGFAVFNDNWQGVVGFPMRLQSDWGYGHDFGFVIGCNARWE